MSISTSSIKESTWSPLRQELFRALWIASVVSNVGSTMHDVGAAWLMTSLTLSPILVSLMTTASNLPLFLLAVPAGAMADVLNKHKLLIVTQVWLMIVAGLLGIMTLAGMTTAYRLLILTLAMGIGGALSAPAWQAVTPEIVPRKDLANAVTLNGVGYNISRVLGPTLGSLIIAAKGPWAVFILNAISFLGIVIVLYRWHRTPPVSVLPAERFVSAIQVGARYVRYSPVLHAIFIRSSIFILCSSALWALLPLYVKTVLGRSVTSFGGFYGFLGAGAITATTILPNIRAKYSMNWQLSGATILFAIVTLIMGTVHNFAILCVAMFVGGMAWLTFMTTVQAAAQLNIPSWVRARALSYYLIVFAGSMSIGSAFWGTVATHIGIPHAFLLSAAGLLVGLISILRYQIPTNESVLDLSPSLHWPEPVVVNIPQPEDGTVMVTVEYHINLKEVAAFTQAMQDINLLRRRDGAIQWGLYHDVAQPGRFLETFIMESWAEHLRQHERVTMEDRKREDKARAFHIGSNPPAISHFIYTHHEEE